MFSQGMAPFFVSPKKSCVQNPAKHSGRYFIHALGLEPPSGFACVDILLRDDGARYAVAVAVAVAAANRKKMPRVMLTGLAQLALSSFSSHSRYCCCIADGDTGIAEREYLKPPVGMENVLSICCCGSYY